MGNILTRNSAGIKTIDSRVTHTNIDGWPDVATRKLISEDPNIMTPGLISDVLNLASGIRSQK
jgi:hypothetical protein